jgi:molecular chaperone DnaJ
MFDHHYKTLGIPSSASLAEIKKAYKVLALKFHPDRNNGDPASEAKFREIAEAYSALSDSIKREKSRGPTGGYEAPFRRYNHKGEYSNSSFRSFWDTVKAAPKVVNMSIDIGFRESIDGTEKKIKYSFENVCGDCDPKLGRHQGASFDVGLLENCPQCHGSGKMKQHQGLVTIFLTCRNCRGAGRVKSGRCETCNNSRKISVEMEAELKIPAGIVSGNILRLTSEDRGTITMVKIHVTPSDAFQRKGNDIYSNLEIPLMEALLGSSKEVQLVRKKCNINIPECIQTGTKIRVRGQGACNVDKKIFGDHYIRIEIKMPEKLTESQKNIIKQLND